MLRVALMPPREDASGEDAAFQGAPVKVKLDLSLRALKTLRKIAGNLARTPVKAKYRTVRAGNTAIKERILQVTGGLEALLALGFTHDATSDTYSKKTGCTTADQLAVLDEAASRCEELQVRMIRSREAEAAAPAAPAAGSGGARPPKAPSPKAPDGPHIKVKFKGAIIFVPLAEGARARDIKSHLEASTGIKTKHQKLICGRHGMLEDSVLISDLGKLPKHMLLVGSTSDAVARAKQASQERVAAPSGATGGFTTSSSASTGSGMSWEQQRDVIRMMDMGFMPPPRRPRNDGRWGTPTRSNALPNGCRHVFHAECVWGRRTGRRGRRNGHGHGSAQRRLWRGHGSERRAWRGSLAWHARIGYADPCHASCGGHYNAVDCGTRDSPGGQLWKLFLTPLSRECAGVRASLAPICWSGLLCSHLYLRGTSLRWLELRRGKWQVGRSAGQVPRGSCEHVPGMDAACWSACAILLRRHIQ